MIQKKWVNCQRCNGNKIYTQLKYCEKCRRILNKEHIIKHRKWALKNTIKYYQKNKDNPEFKNKRNERFKKYFVRRWEKDKDFRIAHRLRNLLYLALKNYTKNGKIMSSRKYDIEYKKILEHLKPFPEDLSKYHIDHIKPLFSFDLTNQEEVKKAFAPENHQWLLAGDNQSKGGKYEGYKNG